MAHVTEKKSTQVAGANRRPTGRGLMGGPPLSSMPQGTPAGASFFFSGAFDLAGRARPSLPRIAQRDGFSFRPSRPARPFTCRFEPYL